MFLFADLAHPQAVPDWSQEELEEPHVVAQTTYSSYATKDTAIDSANPNTNYGNEETVDLGSSMTGESKILISFNNTVPSGEMVTDANLNLTCGIDPIDIAPINIYVSRMKANWDEANATWNNPDTSMDWEFYGAEGESDHSDWEPPFYGYANNTFSIDVTAIVQDAVINSRSSIDLLLAASASTYECHLSESIVVANRPTLEITHLNGTHTNGATLNPNFVEDGAALMNPDVFKLSAATNPTLSWNESNGTDAQIQLSLSRDFKADEDDTWYYNTQDNSSIFTLGTNEGSMVVPTGHELSNSTSMYYRMRSIDSAGTIGQWQTGYFHLPGHNVTENGSTGYGEVTITFDDLGLIDKTIEDTYVDSNGVAKNSNMGTDGTLTVGSSSSADQYGLLRLNMDDIGLHANSSIVSANMVMTRDSYSGTAEVSYHVMENDMWTENGVTWRKYDGTYYWDDGGRIPSMSVGNFEGDQASSKIETDITVAIQNWIDKNNDAIAAGDSPSKTLELMMVASTWGIDETTTQSVNLCTTDSLTCTQPYLEITYDWGSNGPPTIPTHISPSNGHSVWNITGDNLSGNTMPTLAWDGTISWSGDLLLELSTDSEYRNIIHSFDTDTTSEFTPTDGNWSISASDSLDTGVMYHWRLAQLDSSTMHHSWWATSSFLVSSLQSEYLQDDEHRLRLSHGNATTAGDAPSCEDTYIDSGTPSSNYNGEDEMQVSYNTYPAETTILIGCDLTSHLLPTGYAVKTSTLKVRLADYPSGTPTIGVWESRQHNWTEEGATWSTYDGSSTWGTSGAKGWERAGLLDSVQLGNSYTAGDWVEFDITLGAQNAMREDRAVDLVMGIIGVGSGSNRDALFYPNSANSVSRPEISFIYVPGSNALPSDPVPQSPLNGSWSVETGINPAPEDNPQLSWNYVSSGLTGASIGGWSLEMDTTDSFNSPDLIMTTSWTDTGFDITNMTYDLSSPLDSGNTWYWRVRATSSTNQIGNWSDVFHFLLPDITTWSIDSNSAAVELRHREAMPDLNLPNFIDTWVADSGVGSSADQSSSSSIKVGTSTSGENATGLLKIPLTELPNPQNAHISEATLNLYAQFGSDTNNAVSIHSSQVNWNTSANGTTYDGINNWTLPGAMSSADRSAMSDVQTSASADWMNFDVTELVQAAFANGDSHLSLIIVGSIGEGQTIFTSTSGNSIEKPWLNLTWTKGNASTPEVSGTNVNPTIDEIIWDTSTHALLPGSTPSFTWNHSNPSNVDDWRIFIWEDYNDERAGWTMYDSRDSSTGWDLTNLTWTSPSNLDAGDSYEWFVQPITDDILGARGSDTIFHIPSNTGNSINSTDANISLQEGQIVEALEYPAIFMDTYIDSGAIYSSYEGETELIMGRSNQTSSSNYFTETMVMIDWSTMPIPGNHEFLDAKLTLHKISGGETNQETVRIAVCEIQDTWNESVTMDSPYGNSTHWSNPRCDIPFEVTSMDYDDNYIDFDITYAVQHAHASGLDMVNLMFWVLDNTRDEWQFASSDYTEDESKRPELTLSWRTGTQWLPSPASNLGPFDGSSIWNQSASRPRGADNVTMNWTSLDSNETRWIIQTSRDPLFISENSTWISDLTNSNTFNGTWDYSNLAYTTNDNMNWGDYWMYWRVRAEQDHRLGEWSTVNSFRVPGVIGTDDGAGNNTVILSHGSVFEETNALPGIPDATIDSSIPNSISGSNGKLNLGISAGGSGESKIILTFDLSELPFPAAMTPTSALLSLHRSNVTGTSSLTVSAHACDTFVENNITWNSAPTCSVGEITRTTLLVSPENGSQVWDITSLAQSNIANGNNTLTVMLQAVGTPSSGHSFFDNSNNQTLRPKLILDYVDNVDGVVPPAQPVLNNPSDGAILYNTSSWLLESLDKPQLTWSSVTNATGYIITIATADEQLKYKSWLDEEINGTTFTFSQDLVAGEVYSWWVQAINGSIPGPSSSRRAFAIGTPIDHTYNDDHTWTYKFQTGNEVADLGHTNIRDSYIGSGTPNTNHGSDSMIVGTGCGGVNTECRTIIALDNDQVPLPPGAMIHSAALNLYIETAPSGPLTLSVHRLLTNSWTESGSTWNNSESGVPWSTAGMTAGVDYEASPISMTTVATSWTNVWLDIGHENMLIDGDHGWIIIGTSPSGSSSWIEFYSSEDNLNFRPEILINYTDVHSVSVSPSGSTTDADTAVQFSHILNNAVGGMVAEDVEWSSSSGMIDSTGLFTPEFIGTHNITACFGVICTSESITVTPGAPTTLVVDDVEETITADETFTIVAVVHDQFGNIVPGLTINYTPTNGSMSGATFMPYSIGSQSVLVEWNGQTITVNIEVLGGLPTYYTLTGCEGTIFAGNTCQLNWTLHDQYDNLLDLTAGGAITWTIPEGTFTETNGTYFAIANGTHNISMVSTVGISQYIHIFVEHGEMESLEIIASSTAVTADDFVLLNTTRIDIMGNRLPVELEEGNWTISDGELEPGLPAKWEAQFRGTKTITASYEDISSSINIQVTQGVIAGLVLVIDSVDSTNSLQNITTDNSITVKVKAHDNDGNRWTENVGWRIEHNIYTSQDVLQEMIYGSTTIFVPEKSSDTTYTLYATYDVNGTYFEVELSILVGHGDLYAVSLQGDIGNQNPTADETLTFVPKLNDSKDNIIDSSIIEYTLYEFDDNYNIIQKTDITDMIISNQGTWNASTVGNWWIEASATYYSNEENKNITRKADIVNITVTHGDAVSVDIEVEADTATAGDIYPILITGTDSDGNTWDENVIWYQNGSYVPQDTIQFDSENDGAYIWKATTAGVHTFKFESSTSTEFDPVFSEWTVTVSPDQTVARIDLTISEKSVQQLETFEIEVHTFDAWENEIPVPPYTKVELTGGMTYEEIKGENGRWTITTLDDEEQTVTISVDGQKVSGKITVEGTFIGFFESGGTMYYAGGILGLLVILVLLVVIVMALRSGGSEYDDEDDEDDDYQYQEETTQALPPGPIGPGPGGPSGPPPSSQPAQDDWMIDHRVDEDGTEWAEDDTGIWWYREPGTVDWTEWTD